MIDELKTSRVDEETLEALRIRVASLESLIRDKLEEEEADEEEGEGEDKEDDEDSLRDKLAELQRQILMLKEDQSSFGGWQESLSERLEALAELWSSRQDSLTGRVVLLEERSEETREEVRGNGERLREAELMIDMLKRAGETKSKLLFSLLFPCTVLYDRKMFLLQRRQRRKLLTAIYPTAAAASCPTKCPSCVGSWTLSCRT